MMSYLDVEHVELDDGVCLYELSDKDILALQLALWYIDNNHSIRGTARDFSVSKSSVHRALTERIRYLSSDLYLKSQTIRRRNKSGKF
mgnify:FL=1